MRRLYSTFAGGWPGGGLLLMRVVVGSALIVRAGSTLSNTPPMITSLALLCSAGCGFLFISGLWTPIAGLLIALIEICQVVAQPGGRWEHLLVATIGSALAMLGPGLWSLDARLFGWKRIEAPSHKE